MRAQSLSCVRLFATPWTESLKAPLSMEFSSQVYWSGLPFPPPGDLPDPGIKPMCPASPALAGEFFTPEPPGKPNSISERKVKVLVTQSCLTFCSPADCGPPGSSVHGILPARTLEWVAMPFSRGSSWHRDRTGSPALQADSLLSEPPGSTIALIDVPKFNTYRRK